MAYYFDVNKGVIEFLIRNLTVLSGVNVLSYKFYPGSGETVRGIEIPP